MPVMRILERYDRSSVANLLSAVNRGFAEVRCVDRAYENQ